MEVPVVADLTAQVEVNLGHDHAGAGAGKGRGALTRGAGNVGGAVEVAEGLVGRLAVTRGVLVGEGFRADAVDTDGVIAVSDGSVARLDGPESLRETVHSGGGVEDDLCTVKPKHMPVLREVATVADVHADAAELGLEDGLAHVALEVVGRLVEITNAGDVVLARLAEDVARVRDNHGSVPNSFGVILVNLKDGSDNNHVVALSLALEELDRLASLGGLGELEPRVLLAGAEEERAGPGLLQAQHVSAELGGGVNHNANLLFNSLVLGNNAVSGGAVDGVLDRSDANDARLALLLGLGTLHREGTDLKVLLGGKSGSGGRNGNVIRSLTVESLLNSREVLRGNAFLDHVKNIFVLLCGG